MNDHCHDLDLGDLALFLVYRRHCRSRSYAPPYCLTVRLALVMSQIDTVYACMFILTRFQAQVTGDSGREKKLCLLIYFVQNIVNWN